MSENELSIQQRLVAHLSPETPDAGGGAGQASEVVDAGAGDDAPGMAARADVDSQQSPTPEESPQEDQIDTTANENADSGGTEAAADSADDGEEVVEIGEAFNDLADHFGVDVSDLYGLKLSVDVDGKATEVSIGEAKDAFRAKEKLDREQAQLTELRNKATADAELAQQQMQKHMAQVASLIDAAEKQLMSDVDAANLAELRVTDPAEWAAQQQVLTQRQSAIEQAKAQADEAVQHFLQEQQSQLQLQQQELLQRESAALLEAIPEWRDPDAKKKGQDDLRDYLVSAGFSSDEVTSAVDHRLIVLARKAQQFDQRERQVETAKKKVLRFARKTATPGKAQSNNTVRAQRRDAARQTLRKTGRVDDAAAAIRSLME